MNPKLFNTKKNSFTHYLKEIDDLEVALKVTRSTLQDVVQSFVPFKKGDVILIKDRIYKVDRFVNVAMCDNLVKINLKVFYPDSKGGYTDSTGNLSVDFDKIEETIILYIS